MAKCMSLVGPSLRSYSVVARTSRRASSLGSNSPFPAADALLQTLRSALPAHEAVDPNRLAALALGAVHCTARAAALAHMALGSEHALAESSAFAAFFAGLPYPLAAAVLQGASMLGVQGSALALAHNAFDPVLCNVTAD